MAERVGNPVPAEIRDQLERGESPLVFELVTPPKDDGAPADRTVASRLAASLRSAHQHELLLTKNRIAIVDTDRRTRSSEIVCSVAHDEIVSVTEVGAGTERGRLRFDFRDGSNTYVVMGLVFPRPARRFLAAYERAMPGRGR